MRRPLKPFVTEYKASNRRPPASLGEQGLFEPERPASRPFDLLMKADPEDSYDAAMRAADALFSIPAPGHTAEHDNEGGLGPSPSNGSVPHPEKPGGRILRVLDEEPPPEYAELDADHAPKRRGRKPGSKNKPKAVVTALSEPDAAETRIWHTPVAAVPAIPATRTIPAIAANATLANADPGDLAPAPPRSANRFAWGRDRPKPGDAWKRRRLPKVCW